MSPLEFALHAAAQHGLMVDDAVVLQETNNVVVWLRPEPVIAKVGRWSHSREGLLREHRVCSWLSATCPLVNVPVGAPVLDDAGGLTATLWQRMEPVGDAMDADPVELATSLRTVHHSLEACPFELPDFGDGLDLAAATLFGDRRMTNLDVADLDGLRHAFDELRGQVDSVEFVRRPIHGEPHPGNFVVTESGARLIDFETVCSGPVEWDLASLPPEVAGQFDDIDEDLLALLRLLNSARVATWCTASDLPAMQAVGRIFLAVLKGSR